MARSFVCEVRYPNFYSALSRRGVLGHLCWLLVIFIAGLGTGIRIAVSFGGRPSRGVTLAVHLYLMGFYFPLINQRL